jgi:hypothetical protein
MTLLGKGTGFGDNYLRPRAVVVVDCSGATATLVGLGCAFAWRAPTAVALEVAIDDRQSL